MKQTFTYPHPYLLRRYFLNVSPISSRYHPRTVATSKFSHTRLSTVHRSNASDFRIAGALGSSSSSSSSLGTAAALTGTKNTSGWPQFETSVARNVTIAVGQTAFLHCRVYQLGDKEVSLRRLRMTQCGLYSLAFFSLFLRRESFKRLYMREQLSRACET